MGHLRGDRHRELCSRWWPAAAALLRSRANEAKMVRTGPADGSVEGGEGGDGGDDGASGDAGPPPVPVCSGALPTCLPPDAGVVWHGSSVISCQPEQYVGLLAMVLERQVGPSSFRADPEADGVSGGEPDNILRHQRAAVAAHVPRLLPGERHDRAVRLRLHGRGRAALWVRANELLPANGLQHDDRRPVRRDADVRSVRKWNAVQPGQQHLLPQGFHVRRVGRLRVRAAVAEGLPQRLGHGQLRMLGRWRLSPRLIGLVGLKRPASQLQRQVRLRASTPRRASPARVAQLPPATSPPAASVEPVVARVAHVQVHVLRARVRVDARRPTRGSATQVRASWRRARPRA